MKKFSFKDLLNDLSEDVPTNSAGAGNIDGLGVGVRGEPGVYRKKLKLYLGKRTPPDVRKGPKS